MTTDFKFLRVDNNKDLLNATYRLRYEVYCQETHFLDPGDYPDRKEKDVYDDYSLHFAALAPEGDVIGTVRLVLNSDLTFPLEKHCLCLNIDKNGLPRQSLVEISRLVVSKRFRRRAEDGLFGIESYLPKEQGGILNEKADPVPKHIQFRRRRPVIVVGLYRAMYHESCRRGITHWYAAMEKKLWYALKRFAFHFKSIGPEVDYYGPVRPYLGVLSELVEELYSTKPILMHKMLAGLEYHYWPKLGFTFPVRHLAVLALNRIKGRKL